jgi:hypothetical protein
MLGAWVTNFTEQHCPGKVTSLGSKQTVGAGASPAHQHQRRALLGLLSQDTGDGCEECDKDNWADLQGRDGEHSRTQRFGSSAAADTLEGVVSESWEATDLIGPAKRHLVQAARPRAKGSSAVTAEVLSRLASLIEQSCQGVLIVPHGLGAGAGGEDLYLAAMAGQCGLTPWPLASDW